MPRDRLQELDPHMIELHYAPTPNGHKISIALEELGLDYEVHRVNIGQGDQFKPEFLAFSPNNRIPATGTETRLSPFLNLARSLCILLKKQESSCQNPERPERP